MAESSINTGYKIYTTLLKVSNDGNNYPLDDNDELCSISGLPQSSKTNTFGDPDYIEPSLDYSSCPVLIEVNLDYTSIIEEDNTLTTNVNIDNVLSENIDITITYTTSLSNIIDVVVTILAGDTYGTINSNVLDIGETISDSNISNVNPDLIS